MIRAMDLPVGTWVEHLVLGAGEVGRALYKVLSDQYGEGENGVAIQDLGGSEVKANVLHICYPYSQRSVQHKGCSAPDHLDSFTQSVQHDVQDHQDEVKSSGLVIIHSTVPVGTCDARGWVHSPVRGRHPQLVDGLMSFVKHFGGERAAEAAEWFDACNIVTMIHDRARDTEAGKLWELVQYGMQIRIEKAIHEWCERNGVSFKVAYTLFAETYNDGYARRHPEFVRPVIAHMPGPIGGHCVRQASAWLSHPLAELVSQGCLTGGLALPEEVDDAQEG